MEQHQLQFQGLTLQGLESKIKVLLTSIEKNLRREVLLLVNKGTILGAYHLVFSSNCHPLTAKLCIFKSPEINAPFLPGLVKSQLRPKIANQ